MKLTSSRIFKRLFIGLVVVHFSLMGLGMVKLHVPQDYVSVYGVHRYLHNLVFLAMWMPMAHVWSVDRWRSGAKARA